MIDQTQQPPSSRCTASGLEVTLRPARAYRRVEAVTLRQGLYAIGAAADGDVVLPVGGVQRLHCRIEVDDDVATLTADSRMTWVNDQPVDSRDLCDGDRLAIGPVEFTVEIRELAPEVPDGTQGQPLRAEEFDALYTSQAGATLGEPALSAAVDRSGTDDGATAAQLTEARQMLARHETKLAQTEQVIAELEQRREQLQSVVDELLESAAAERNRSAGREQEERRRRDGLSRLENEASVWRAALTERARDIDQLQGDLERRFSALQQVELDIETQSNELERAAEELAVRQRDQSEREALLQSRLEEVGHSEATFNESAAELRRRSDELDDRAELLARQNEELQQQFQDLEQQRRDLEAVAQAESDDKARSEHEHSQLSEQLRACEEELGMLRAQRADQESDQTERELQLREREAELEDLSTQLHAQFETLELRESELQTAGAELDSRQQQLDAQQQECRRVQDKLDAENRVLEESRQQMQHFEQQLCAQGGELETRSVELQQRLLAIKSWRSELRQQAADPSPAHPDVESEKSGLAELQADLQRREAEWVKGQAELLRGENDLRERTSELHARQQQVDEREGRLQQTLRDVSVRDGDVQSAWVEIAESREQLDRQREEFGTKFETLARERRTLREDQEAMDVLRRNLQERQRELEDERRRCRDQLASADAAEQQQELDRRGFETAQESWRCERARFVAELGTLNARLDELQRQPDEGDGGADAGTDAAPSVATGEARDLFDFEEDDHEIIEDELVDGEEIVPERIQELRSQMQDLFGYDGSSAKTLPESAVPEETATSSIDERHDVDDIDDVTDASLEDTGDVDPSDVACDGPAAGHTDVITHERQRSSAEEDTTGESTVEPAAELDTPWQDASEPPATVDADAPDSLDVSDSASAEGETPAAANEAALVRQESMLAADLERQKLNSLREVANLSARSALARHASTELKNTLLAEGLVTGMCVTGTIVLLASPLWSQTSLVPWGVLFAAVSGLLIWRTLRTTARMQNHLTAGKSRKKGGQTAAPNEGESKSDPSSSSSTEPQDAAGEQTDGSPIDPETTDHANDTAT